MIRRWGKPPAEEVKEPKGFDDYDMRLGDLMRGERATLGKSLLDVQRELKIKASYIAAIENADPTAFETPGFIAGYVRSYARYLDLDPEWAYGRFCAEGNFAVGHGLSPAARNKPEPVVKTRSADPFGASSSVFAPRGESMFARIEPSAVGSIAVLVALVAGLGYGGWSVFQEIQRVDMAPLDTAPGVTAELDPLVTPGAAIEGQVAEVGFTAPSTDALDRLYRPQALDVPVLTARDGPIATIDTSDVGVLASATPTLDAPVTETAPASIDDAVAAAMTDVAPAVQVNGPDAPELAIFAVRPSWVRVRAANGTVIFEKILDAGERFVLPATEEPHTLRSGNSGSVYFAVNGQAYGPAGDGAVVSNLALSVDNLTSTYQVADLSKDSDLARVVAVAQADQAGQ